MYKKYKRLLVPHEFNEWIEKRRMKLENISKNMGYKRKLTKMRAMRMLSQVDGVEIDRSIIQKISSPIRLK